jgi:hypothetical protein
VVIRAANESRTIENILTTKEKPKECDVATEKCNKFQRKEVRKKFRTSRDVSSPDHPYFKAE